MLHPPDRATTRRGYLVATLGIALATLILMLVRGHLGNAHTGLVYLLVVAAAAASGGTRPGLLAAVLSFLAWDFFFLPPFYTLTLEDPRNWILLCVFLIIGILIGQMTGRIRMREEEAVARERDMAALYHATQAVTSHPDLGGALASMLDHIAASAGAESCAILTLDNGDPVRRLAGRGLTEALPDPAFEALCRWTAEQAKAVGLGAPPPYGGADEEVPWPVSVEPGEAIPGCLPRSDVFVPLITRDGSYGVLYARPAPGHRFSGTNARLLAAFASQTAAFLERQRLQDEAARVATQQEAERLRSILFSSLSHNLKTPLASLGATLGSLREEDVEWQQDELRESLGLMAEDLNRLTLNLDNLLSLAQLEAGNWQPQREWVELRELVGTALRHFPEGDYGRIRLGELADDLMVEVDTIQLSQVVRHLVENALAYSPAASRVEIDAHVRNGAVELTVDDGGAGIGSAERERVFSKFYRGQAAMVGAVRGTGLGLPICREIVAAHGGTIRVEDSPLGGARLTVTLPR